MTHDPKAMKKKISDKDPLEIIIVWQCSSGTVPIGKATLDIAAVLAIATSTSMELGALALHK